MKTFESYTHSVQIRQIRDLLSAAMIKITELEGEQRTPHSNNKLQDITTVWRSIKTAFDTLEKMEKSETWGKDNWNFRNYIRPEPELGKY